MKLGKKCKPKIANIIRYGVNPSRREGLFHLLDKMTHDKIFVGVLDKTWTYIDTRLKLTLTIRR